MPIDPAPLVERALTGDRGAVAKLISLVEAGGEPARRTSALLYPETGDAYTVGLTGAPGAGKSSLTDALIRRLRRDGIEVGVLAIDPTSPFSGGAILGDRVRMQDHAIDEGVYIRSMATRGHLGGLALATPLAARVLDAAGKPWVLIETVGVGQVEVEIAGAADTTVVVVNPGWGDGVQANKAGLLEIADLFVVNKADRDGVAETVRDLEMMLDLTGHMDVAAEGRSRPSRRAARASTSSGTRSRSTARTRSRAVSSSGGARRACRDELRGIVLARLREEAESRCSGEQFEKLVAQVAARDLDPYAAAEELLGT